MQRVSMVEEGAERKFRMANLAIVGSHSTNGVAAIHSQLLRTVTVKDLAELFPRLEDMQTQQLRAKGILPMDPYETKLTPADELKYQDWKARNAPNDTGADYDLRGAFKAGAQPAENGHWPDTFKKPNHPTFSNESQYATGENAAKAGHWERNAFVPPQAAQTEIPRWGNFYRSPKACRARIFLSHWIPSSGTMLTRRRGGS